jgi:hypothetical protein
MHRHSIDYRHSILDDVIERNISTTIGYDLGNVVNVAIDRTCSYSATCNLTTIALLSL